MGVVGGITRCGCLLTDEDRGKVWSAFLKNVEWASLRFGLRLLIVLKHNGHGAPHTWLTNWRLIYFMRLIDICTDARGWDHLQTLCLRVEDLVSHRKRGNVSIDRGHNAFLSLFPPWWWTRHCDTPRVHDGLRVLNGRQEGKDHRVLQVWSILGELTLALLDLERGLCILGRLRHDTRALTIQVLQTVQLFACCHTHCTGGSFIPGSYLRLFSVMRHFIRASLQNAPNCIDLRRRDWTCKSADTLRDSRSRGDEVDLARRYHRDLLGLYY